MFDFVLDAVKQYRNYLEREKFFDYEDSDYIYYNMLIYLMTTTNDKIMKSLIESILTDEKVCKKCGKYKKAKVETDDYGSEIGVKFECDCEVE